MPRGTAFCAGRQHQVRDQSQRAGPGPIRTRRLRATSDAARPPTAGGRVRGGDPHSAQAKASHSAVQKGSPATRPQQRAARAIEAATMPLLDEEEAANDALRVRRGSGCHCIGRQGQPEVDAAAEAAEATRRRGRPTGQGRGGTTTHREAAPPESASGRNSAEGTHEQGRRRGAISGDVPPVARRFEEEPPFVGGFAADDGAEPSVVGPPPY